MGERRDIVCPCGNLLGFTTNVNGGGEKFCSSCKRTIKYSASANGVYTSVKK